MTRVSARANPPCGFRLSQNDFICAAKIDKLLDL
jgi:hypothetical protein